MKAVFLLLAVCQTIFSCSQPGQIGNKKNQNGQQANQAEEEQSLPDIASLTKDFQTWYNYTYYQVRLSRDFIPLDIDSAIISRKQFLTKMTKGPYIPFAVKNHSDTPVYRLYKPEPIDPDIQSVSQASARQELTNDTMEGTELPDVTFTDINGHEYNKANTKGKLILLKCWFINCTACVAEFPELNQLTEEYRSKGVLFISLARDSKDNLIAFLKKKPFKYAVVLQQETTMNAMGINTFPTHILIDQNGKILKVTNYINDMLPALQKATANLP